MPLLSGHPFSVPSSASLNVPFGKSSSVDSRQYARPRRPSFQWLGADKEKQRETLAARYAPPAPAAPAAPSLPTLTPDEQARKERESYTKYLRDQFVTAHQEIKPWWYTWPAGSY